VDKSKRLRFLTEKYNNDSLTKKEYEEFLAMLNSLDTLSELDELLTSYWQQTAHGAVKESSSPEEPISFTRKKKRRLLNWGIAASLLILLTATIHYFARPLPGPYITYETGFGEVKEVDLPDGSVVTLNANSELSWDSEWAKEDARHVKLRGEAFFDIKHLHGMTFTVQTGDVSVEVVGTSFNVDSRNRKTEVYLDEGKVKLHVEQGTSDVIVMEPGEKVKYDGENGKIIKTENESMISAAPWKKGVLSFKDMEFREVLEKLTAIYGKTFTCTDDSLLSKHIYLGVPYADWDKVKEALELSMDIHISQHADTYVISKE